MSVPMWWVVLADSPVVDVYRDQRPLLMAGLSDKPRTRVMHHFVTDLKRG
jgi:hypothetical protein